MRPKRAWDLNRSKWFVWRRDRLDKAVRKWLRSKSWEAYVIPIQTANSRVAFVSNADLITDFGGWQGRPVGSCTSRALSESLMRLGYRRHRREKERGFIMRRRMPKNG